MSTTPDCMSIPYYQVDAFTGRVFSGNPAGVCILAGWLPDALMQSIAAENNLAETAFIVPRGSGRYDLRWFTPEVEANLCGHATVALAHVLFGHLGFAGERIDFETRSGTLGVSRDGDLFVLDFPSLPAKPCEPPPGLIEGLGRTPIAVAKSKEDYLAIFETEQEIAALQPDMAALMRVEARGVAATAPGRDADFVSRFFGPRVGIPEDPVTGSAHCALMPYWSARLGRNKLRAQQISKRGGELFCELKGDRVAIAGRAVTYSTGHSHVPVAK